MATNEPTQARGDRPRGLAGFRQRSTETKEAFKTTEFIAYLAVLAAILIAGLIVDADGDDVGFEPDRVWLYATLLTIGYMVSRGLAKSGSRDPYTDE